MKSEISMNYLSPTRPGYPYLLQYKWKQLFVYYYITNGVQDIAQVVINLWN